jgi:hypothetical protein
LEQQVDDRRGQGDVTGGGREGDERRDSQTQRAAAISGPRDRATGTTGTEEAVKTETAKIAWGRGKKMCIRVRRVAVWARFASMMTTM